MKNIYLPRPAGLPARPLNKPAFVQDMNFFAALVFVMVLIVTAMPVTLFAQAPSISYASPHTYVINTAITALSPTNSGGAVSAPGYSTSPVDIFSGTSYSGSVALDASGNVYTFDYSVSNNYKFVKLSSTGTNPVALITFLSRPEDIAIDPSGNVFVLDGSTIYKVTPGGTVSTFQNVSQASGIGLDAAGNVYVARYSSSTTSVLEFPANGGSSISIGSGLSYMTDVAVDAAGNVYVCNDGDASIKEIPAGGGSMITIASGFETTGHVSDLSQIITDPAGNLFFSEANSAKVSEIPAGSTTPIAIGSGFFAPGGLTFDASGNLYVIDNGTLKEFKPVGGYFISPALPAGLSFNSNTGIISGTPTVASPATTYKITASNSSGSSSATVNITVEASLSTVAALSNLVISRTKNGNSSTAILTPAFNSGTMSYSIDAPNSTSTVTVTPTVTDANATVKVNSTTVASGSASAGINLNVGANTITTVVTAQDGTTTDTYTVSIDRRNTSGQLDGFNEPISVNQAPNPPLGEDGIMVHPALSPNGDGINDVFTIDGLNNYPDNKVTIMSRDGVIIYQAQGYDNSTKVFDGHSNLSGVMQLPGTYFYSLEYQVGGDTKRKTGYIILKY